MARGNILGSVAVKLGIISKDFDRGLRGVELKMKRFGKSTQRLGESLVRNVTLPMALAGGASLKLASDAEETENRFNSVFGSMSGSVREFARSIADATGRNFFQIQDGLASFQGMAQGIGLSNTEASKFAKQLQELSIDFASFNNLSDAEAQERFISAMSGSSEVLDKFGVNLRASNLDLKLQELGLAKSTKEATEAQKAIARLEIIKDVMGKQGALGDAVRTSDSFANQMRSVTSQLTELGVEIGKVLMPVAQEVLGVIKTMIGFAKSLDKNVLAKIVKLAGLVAIGGALLVGLGAVATALSAIGWPALLIAGAIAALVAGIIYLSENLPAFEAMMINSFRNIAEAIIDSVQAMLMSFVSFSNMPGLVGSIGQMAVASLAGLEGLKQNLPVAQDAKQFGSFGDAISGTLTKLMTKFGLFSDEAKKVKQEFQSVTDETPTTGVGGEESPEKVIELTRLQIAQAQALGQAFDAIGESFARTFVDGVSNMKNFGEAFKAMGKAIVQALKEVIVQMIKLATFKFIGSLFGLSGVTSGFDLAKGLLGGGGASAGKMAVGASAGKMAIQNQLFINGRKMDIELSRVNSRNQIIGG